MELLYDQYSLTGQKLYVLQFLSLHPSDRRYEA